MEGRKREKKIEGVRKVMKVNEFKMEDCRLQRKKSLFDEAKIVNRDIVKGETRSKKIRRERIGGVREKIVGGQRRKP